MHMYGVYQRNTIYVSVCVYYVPCIYRYYITYGLIYVLSCIVFFL